jgi:hypothetical protein
MGAILIAVLLDAVQYQSRCPAAIERLKRGCSFRGRSGMTFATVISKSIRTWRTGSETKHQVRQLVAKLS